MVVLLVLLFLSTKLRCALRLRAWSDSKNTAENEEDKIEYIPGLYLPSMCVPPLAPTHIENGLAAFEVKLDDHLEHRKSDREDNLTFYQRWAMKKLKNNPAIHVCDADKNLDPPAIGNQFYLKQVYEEHLTSSTFFS
jgi:hypothetical protein